MNRQFIDAAQRELADQQCNDIACTEMACNPAVAVCSDEGLCVIGEFGEFDGRPANEGDCEDLREGDCSGREDCVAVFSAPPEPWCFDPNQPARSFAYCSQHRVNARDCPVENECAVDPMTGLPRTFEGCWAPPGWARCDDPACD